MLAAPGNTTMPPALGSFDYQLAGRYPADARVKIISSDANINADPSQPARADQPLDKSRYNICYLNVFQTQPEDSAYWMGNHPDLILKNAAGQPLHDPDPDWAGELMFDISTQAKRTELLAVQKSWIMRCAANGFKAIEPDNQDAYERSLGAYTAEDAQSFMQLFVAEAHAQGLAVAQKNVASWVSELGANGKPRAAAIGFDFAIIEECQLTGECDEVIMHYGAARVFEIEYVYDSDDKSSGMLVAANSSQHFTTACSARGSSTRIVLRNRDVRPSTAAGYVFQLCGQAAAPTASTVARTTTGTATAPATTATKSTGTAGSAGTGGAGTGGTGGVPASTVPPRTTTPVTPTVPPQTTTPVPPRTTTPVTPSVPPRTTTPVTPSVPPRTTTPTAPPRTPPATPPVGGRAATPATTGAGGSGARMKPDGGVDDDDEDDDEDDDDSEEQPGTRGATGVGGSSAGTEVGPQQQPGTRGATGVGGSSAGTEVGPQQQPETRETAGAGGSSTEGEVGSGEVPDWRGATGTGEWNPGDEAGSEGPEPNEQEQEQEQEQSPGEEGEP